MSDFRKVNDRNLVVFGIPDVEIEREIGYIYNELERRPVAPSAAPPTIPAPFVPYVAPSSMLLDLDGLTTSPQLLYKSVSGSLGNAFDDIEDCTFVIDPNNGLGAGANALWLVPTFPEDPSSAKYILVSHDKSTNTTTRYFPNPPEYLTNTAYLLIGYVLNKYKLHAIGDKIYGFETKPHASSSMPYFDLSQPDLGTTPDLANGNELPFTASTPTGNVQQVHKIDISGTTYLLNNNGYVYNSATNTWSGPIAKPVGSGIFNGDLIANGQYMWAYNSGNRSLYTAQASLAPTWTLVYTFPSGFGNPSFNTETGETVCVSPASGELFWLRQRSVVGSSPNRAHYRLDSFDFNTGTRTIREDIFGVPNGLPASGIIYDTQFSGTAPIHPQLRSTRIVAGTNFVAILGPVRSDALGTTVDKESINSEILWVPAVWTVQGSGPTLDTVATLVTHSDLSLDPTPTSATWGKMVYGHIEAEGNKLYTWLGWTLFEAHPVPDVYVESRVREWEIV